MQFHLIYTIFAIICNLNAISQFIVSERHQRWDLNIMYLMYENMFLYFLYVCSIFPYMIEICNQDLQQQHKNKNDLVLKICLIFYVSENSNARKTSLYLELYENIYISVLRAWKVDNLKVDFETKTYNLIHISSKICNLFLKPLFNRKTYVQKAAKINHTTHLLSCFFR